MWLSDLILKRNERAKKYLTEKEKYIMAVLWEDDRDLSIYEIMGILHEDYLTDFVSTTIEHLLFQLSQKEFVHIYIQNHMLFVHCLITREVYSERIRQKELWLQEKYRWNSRWEESYGGSLTEKEAQELRELLHSLEDDEK